MKKLRLLTLALCMMLYCHADVQTTATLEPITAACRESSNQTLLLLDIEGTILAFCDPVLHKAHEKWTKAWFQQNCPDITKEETIKLVHIVESQNENWLLVDKTWPQTILTAQNAGAKVVALTKVLGLNGKRSEKLTAFNIKLKNDLPELSKGLLFEYHDGVIETEAPLKGPVLEEILQNLAVKPKKIIFVDDRINQIESVEEVCRNNGIGSISFHYTQTLEPPELDAAIADIQLRTLVQEHRWIPTNTLKSDKGYCKRLVQ